MKKKVLLVEDDDSLSLALKIRLESLGYNPIVAKDVASAMSMVVSRKPDVILVDVNLPDGTGFMLAKQIINSPNTPIIPINFISANSSTEFNEQAINLSSVPLLEKPFRTSQLINALERMQHTIFTRRRITKNVRVIFNRIDRTLWSMLRPWYTPSDTILGQQIIQNMWINALVTTLALLLAFVVVTSLGILTGSALYNILLPR